MEENIINSNENRNIDNQIIEEIIGTDNKDIKINVNDIFDFKFLLEKDVGITEYYNDGIGFSCILKHRYSDFLVNEIDYTGKVVWAEKEKEKIDFKSIKEEKLKNREEKKKENNDLTLNEDKLAENELKINNCLNQFKLIFDKETNLEIFENLNNYLRDLFIDNPGNNTNKSKSNSFKLPYLDNKDDRKKFHEILRHLFSGKIESETKKDENIIIFPNFNENNNNKFNNSRSRTNLPDIINQNYLICTLLKRNSDMNYTINYISKFIHRSNKSIKFAGNKDKRGITTQKISFFKVSKEELIQAQQKTFWDKKFELSNFEYSENEYRLGLLQGNQFSVCLRFLKEIDSNNTSNNDRIKSIVESSIYNLKQGFINYFGMQRFGSGQVPTNIIGKHAIKKEWFEVISLILKSQHTKNAIEKAGLLLTNISDIFNEFNMKAIMSKLDRKAFTENKLFNSLKTNPGNYYNAFKGLNKTLRLLYPHAYQSYIWNKAVSYRLKKYGKNLINGDIVMKNNSSNKNFEFNNNLIDENDDEIDCEILNNTSISTDINFEEVFEYIDENNVSKYQISDLYMSLAGTDVRLPKNDVNDYILSLLKEDNIDINEKGTMLGSGGYRKVIQIPTNIKYDFVTHDDINEELQNEYYNDDLKNHPIPSPGKHLSLRFVFQVPQSTYATMVFREVTKQPSDLLSQSELTNFINSN